MRFSHGGLRSSSPPLTVSRCRRRSARGMVVGVLVSAVTVGSAGGAPAGAADSPLSSFSASQLFLGSMMGVGPVAARLPEDVVTAVDVEPGSIVDQSMSNLVRSIRLHHPGFLTRFKQAAVSGDLLRVRGAIDDAQVVLSRESRRTANTTAATDVSLALVSSSGASTTNVALHAGDYLAFYKDRWIFRNWFAWHKKQRSGGSLQHDRLVFALANAS